MTCQSNGRDACVSCRTAASQSRLDTAEKNSAKAIGNAQALAATYEPADEPTQRDSDDNGGSSLYLIEPAAPQPQGNEPAATAAEPDSSLYLIEASSAAKVLQPGAMRKRFRQIVDALRGAAVRRSENRRQIAAAAVEAERAAELDAACDRLDQAENELELELVAQTQDGPAGDVAGAKKLLEFEALQCEDERNQAKAELTLIQAAWTPRDDKMVNNRHTKAWERRVYLSGQPTQAPVWAPASGFSDRERRQVKEELAQIKSAWSPRDDKLTKGVHTRRWERREYLRGLPKAEAQLNGIRQAWTPADDETVGGRHTKAWEKRVHLERRIQFGREGSGLPTMAPKWSDSSEFGGARTDENCYRGHLGMLSNRAATARQIANDTPDAAERTVRIARARGEVLMAKRELASASQAIHWDDTPETA